MGTKWTAKKYEEGDEAQILKLREIVFGGTRSREYWKWQFQDGPAGPAIIWLAVADEKVVGQYVVVPQRMKIGDEIIIGSFGLDEMTHPNYRGQGIITKLAQNVFQAAGQQGIHVTYGIPNNQIHPLYIEKLEWFNISQIQTMCKIFNLGNVLKKKINLPRFIGSSGQFALDIISSTMDKLMTLSHMPEIEIKEIHLFDDTISEFCLNASKNQDVTIIRDKKYLNWRYVNKPGFNYTIFQAERIGEILGYIVFHLRNTNSALKIGYIADILLLSGEKATLHALVNKTIEDLKKRGADMVLFRTLKSMPYYNILKKMGFQPLWFRKTQLSAHVNSTKVPKELLQAPSNWYFTIGDTDEI
jgi:GNAT superfamily N-acetyltransferase